MMQSYMPEKYEIKNVKPITSDVKLLRVKSNMNPLPGQFIEVSIPGIGECPLASCSFNEDYVDILLRNAGPLTSKISQLKEGDNIYIRGPYGKGFPLEAEEKNIILAAGGTGIAPVTSFIDYIEKNRERFGNIHIYLGFRDADYILLKDRIERWKKKFNVTVTLDKKCKGYPQGFINQIIEKKHQKTENSLAFICGPEIMMDSITKSLKKLGMKEKDIFWSMERRMECGFGNCGRCMVQDVYVCKDGPVFNYEFIKPRLENEQSANKILLRGKAK